MSDAPPITSRSATELATAIRDGGLRAAEVTDAFLARIASHDTGLGSFIEVWGDAALAEAEAVDAARARGDALGPLGGVPVAIKDNYVRRGFRTGCASKILDGFVSPYTSTAVARLEAAGAILLGRTNMDEFAMGSSTEHSIHGATKNPFDPARTCGGSSGGSAAAVAARFAPLALGSDTGGSVRQPAAFCGVSGLKPTYGRISRFGLVSFASSLDTVSPFGRTVADTALALAVLAGMDRNDSTSLADPAEDYTAGLDGSLDGMRVGVPAEYFGDGLDPVVEEHVRAAIAQLSELGATTVPIELPHTRYAVPTYYLICTSEASSNLSRYDGVRFGHRAGGDQDLDTMYSRTRAEGFGSEVKLRILLGTFCLSSGYYDAYYLKASKVRTLIREDFERAFTQCDVLAAPTSPFPAFDLGSKTDDPLAMYLSDVLTVAPSLAGVPAISVPCGATTDGLPIGMQLIGPALGEAKLLHAAHAFEQSTGHHLVEPCFGKATS